MKTLIAFALVMATSVPAKAQRSTGAEVVSVPVTITSLDRSQHIAGLTAAEFRVSENGDRQDVTSVTRERVPISLAIVVDSGTTMLTGMRRQLAAESVDKVVSALGPEDEFTVLFLGRTVEQRLPWTSGKGVTALNWDGWNPTGVASLHDGLRDAFARLQEARNTRHAILVLTPGFESSSRMSLSNLVKSRQASETSLFAFGLGSHRQEEAAAEESRVLTTRPRTSDDVRKLDPLGSGIIAPKPLMQADNLDQLVGDSGGMVTRVLSMPEATMAARNLIAELHNQYLVSFTPKKPLDGKYRKLKIEVNRKGTYVRHRGGYLAVPARD
ncbi:MAG TPA: VWA domain-containing protein [Vicinamibacterales bacterium]|nr:VWA domain-containing protein [Vicinamibacterales bacterium]